MANQTISSDSNHDDLTGRNAGENITVTAGATLTIDSMPQLTSSGLMGQCIATEGEVHFDASNCKQITYDGGSGTRPVVGATITNGTQTGTAKVIEDQAGNSDAAGTFTVTLLTGTFADNDSISSGAWSASVNQSTFPVGFMRVFAEAGQWTATGLGTYRFTGATDGYLLGTGDGTDSQSFTLPHSGIQPGIWVETGSGTGVYEKWYRMASTAAFTDFGLGDLGQVFQQTNMTSTVTFGTSVNGGRPANGARIIIPNLHMGSATLGAPTTEFNNTNSNLLAYLAPSGAYTLIANDTSFSTFAIRLERLSSADLTGCVFNGRNSNTIGVMDGPITIDDCVISRSSGVDSNTTVRITDQIIGVTATNTIFSSGATGSFGDVMPVETSTNISITGGKLVKEDPSVSNRGEAITFTSCTGCTVDGMVMIAGTMCLFSSSSNISVKNTKFATSANDNNVNTTTKCVQLTGGSSDILIDGVELIGQRPDQYFIDLADSINFTLRNIGSPSSKVDLTGTGSAIRLSGSNQGLKVQNVYFDGHTDARVFLPGVTQSNFEITNCSFEYDKELELTSNGFVAKGVHCGSGAFNATTGIEVDYVSSSANNFFDVFTSDTTGKIGCVFTPPGAIYASKVTISSGTPVFNKVGDLLMRTTGDQVVMEFPYELRGHTGFSNTAPLINGASTGNLDIEYALDTGSGFGSYSDATGVNLSGESVSAAGFGLRIRLTANSTSTATLVNGVALVSTTTITDQENNPYSIAETGTLLINVLDAADFTPIVGATVYILANSSVSGALTDNEVLLAGVTDGSGQATVAVGLTEVQPVDGVVRKGSASPYYKSTAVISSISPGLTNEITVLMVSDE